MEQAQVNRIVAQVLYTLDRIAAEPPYGDGEVPPEAKLAAEILRTNLKEIERDKSFRAGAAIAFTHWEQPRRPTAISLGSPKWTESQFELPITVSDATGKIGDVEMQFRVVKGAVYLKHIHARTDGEGCAKLIGWIMPGTGKYEVEVRSGDAQTSFSGTSRTEEEG